MPPDITDSKQGELVAGLVALALFVLVIVAVVFLMSGRRRWPFVIVQVATIATCIDFIADETTGSPFVPILLLITSAAGLVLALVPQTAAHVRRPGRLAAADPRTQGLRLRRLSYSQPSPRDRSAASLRLATAGA